MLHKKHPQAFTLVELIVVVTILAFPIQAFADINDELGKVINENITKKFNTGSIATFDDKLEIDTFNAEYGKYRFRELQERYNIENSFSGTLEDFSEQLELKLDTIVQKGDANIVELLKRTANESYWSKNGWDIFDDYIYGKEDGGSYDVFETKHLTGSTFYDEYKIGNYDTFLDNPKIDDIYLGYYLFEEAYNYNSDQSFHSFENRLQNLYLDETEFGSIKMKKITNSNFVIDVAKLYSEYSYKNIIVFSRLYVKYEDSYYSNSMNFKNFYSNSPGSKGLSIRGDIMGRDAPGISINQGILENVYSELKAKKTNMADFEYLSFLDNLEKQSIEKKKSIQKEIDEIILKINSQESLDLHRDELKTKFILIDVNTRKSLLSQRLLDEYYGIYVYDKKLYSYNLYHEIVKEYPEYKTVVKRIAQIMTDRKIELNEEEFELLQGKILKELYIKLEETELKEISSFEEHRKKNKTIRVLNILLHGPYTFNDISREFDAELNELFYLLGTD